MNKSILYIGMDVHAQTIAIALAESGGEVRNFGSITNDLKSLERALTRIKKAHPGAEPRVCQEAGPAGFVIARRLSQPDIDRAVAAPSLIPGRSGDRIRTGTGDAVRLARPHRAGELTAVRVPDAVDEAMRDLRRARTDAVRDLRRSRTRMKAFLPRHGYRYPGKSSWTEAHRLHLRGLVFSHRAHRLVLEDALRVIAESEARIKRLEEGMETLLEQWRMKPVVRALMGMRGFRTVGAMVPVSEPGNGWRFAHPRQPVACPGLVPSESGSGGQGRQGAPGRTGNGHARWLPVEAAHHCRPPPKVSKGIKRPPGGTG